MVKGTLTRRARVFASNVFPHPVGPSTRTLLFSISTSAWGEGGGGGGEEEGSFSLVDGSGV